MKKCRHRFQPRYDRVWSTAIRDVMENAPGGGGIEMTQCNPTDPYLASQTYLYDICVRCGVVVGRE